MKKISFIIMLAGLCAAAAYGQSITVTSPNGGETWTTGTTQFITWSAAGVDGDVKIMLIKGADNLGNIANRVRARTGSFSWRVGTTLADGATYGAGANYRVQVQSRENAAVRDRSNGNFAIASGPFIRVIYPNGGERIGLPATLRIRWEASPSIASVKLMGKDPIQTYPVEAPVPNTGSFELALDESPLDGRQYKLRIEDAANPAVFDESDGVFELYHIGPPVIRVIKPIAGDHYIGTEYSILWERSGFDGQVKVELWQGGSKAGTIAERTQGTQRNWRIDSLPDWTVAAGDGYYIRISALHAAGVFADSARFRIVAR